jgi:hypothetical protein
MAAATPTIDDLRKLSYAELMALQNYPQVSTTKAYQQAVTEAMSKADFDPTAQNPVGQFNQNLASAVQKLGLGGTAGQDAAQGAADLKAQQAQANADKIVATAQTGGKLPYVLTQDRTAVALAQKQAQKKAGAAGLTAVNALIGSSAIPDWLMNQTNTKATVYTKKEKQKVVDTWNRQNPGHQVSSWDDFIATHRDPTEEAKAAVQFAGLSAPDRAHEFTLPDGSKYTVTQHDLEGVAGAGGTGIFGAEKMPYVQDAINMAASISLRDPYTNELMWQPLLAMQKLGKISFVHDTTTPIPKATPSPFVPPTHPTAEQLTGHIATNQDRQALAALGGGVAGLPRQGGAPVASNAGKWLGNLLSQFNSSIMFETNYIATGDATLALIKTVAPDLYPEVVQNGKVKPTSVAAANRVDQILTAAGWYDMPHLGYAVNQDTLKDLLTFVDTSQVGGSTTHIQLPDPLKVDQTLKDLFNNWFGMEPSAQQFEAFRNKLYTQLQGTVPVKGQPMDPNIDPGAQIRQFAEQSPQYQSLFANKPAGMTADDYVNQNRQAVSGMLGHQLNPAAVRAGQLAGTPTAAAAAAAGDKSSLDNSTFMDRLARAAQVISANT